MQPFSTVNNQDKRVDKIISDSEPKLSEFAEGEAISIDEFVIKMLKSDDRRSVFQDFKDVKKGEVKGLQERDICTTLAPGAIVMGEIFLHTLKNMVTSDERPKFNLLHKVLGTATDPLLVMTLQYSERRILGRFFCPRHSITFAVFYTTLLRHIYNRNNCYREIYISE